MSPLQPCLQCSVAVVFLGGWCQPFCSMTPVAQWSPPSSGIRRSGMCDVACPGCKRQRDSS